jgi:hypothetical protein
MREKRLRYVRGSPGVPRDLGTLNPDSFKLPVFQRTKTHSPLEDIAELSAIAESLKETNDDLKARLDIICNYPTSIFEKFQKDQVALDVRCRARESELHDFASHFDSFRRSSDPTFVEVDAAQVRRMDSDPILASLLVSNDQRSFFSNANLVTWNSELVVLISRQKDSLRELNGRLKIFDEYFSENWARHTVESLKNGELPDHLAISAPSRLAELEGKRKLLQAELSRVVKIRQELAKAELAEKNRQRYRNRITQRAITIQKVMRGFLARREVARMRAAGLILTSVARGFLVRIHRKQLREHFAELMEHESGRSEGPTTPREDKPS